MFLKVLLIQCLKSNCQKVKTTISKSFENFVKLLKNYKSFTSILSGKNDLFREPWCLQLTQFLFSEVEHLINSGTYEPRNQGDTLTIKWKLQSPQ